MTLPHARIRAVNPDGTLTREFRTALEQELAPTEAAAVSPTDTSDKQDASERLDAIVAMEGAGLAVREPPGSWRTRSVAAGTGINVTNGNGLGGNPTVALADLADAGTGTFKLLTRDLQGRVSGTVNGTAANVPYVNTASGLAATNVQAAVDEVAANSDGGDPYFAAVDALLHFDGTDGTTVFTDETGRTWSAPGAGVLDDAHPAFGPTSLHAGGVISTPGATLTGDFTIEGWVYMTANSGTRAFFRAGNEAAGRVAFEIVAGQLSYNVYGSASVTFTAINVPLNTLTHIAFERHYGVIRWYVGGRQAGSSNDVTTLGNAVELSIGAGAEHWVDDVRFANGVARHKGEFLIPTAAYPNR